MLHRLLELIRLFGKLGIAGFGGPAVHIGWMEDEVVERRGWLTHEHFLDLVGATNLIPGPNSTEMTMHVGYHRAGYPGLIVAGLSFIVPAVVITGFFAWFYGAYGALPAVEPFLAGIKPAVLAVILSALFKLSSKALRRRRAQVIALVATAACLGGIHELAVIIGIGVIGMLWMLPPKRPGDTVPSGGLLLPLWAAAAATGAVAVPKTLGNLALAFLKVGLVMYGSGYVLFAFLEGDLVHRFAWLTNQQLLDAIAIGQFTPGPLLSTSTFVGYQVLGWSGALVASACVFLPSFVYVALAYPLVPKLRKSRYTGAFLDAVNASALGLMAGVLLKLSWAALLVPREAGLPWGAWIIAALAVIGSRRWKLNNVWLIAGGSALGALCHLVGAPV